MCGIIGIIKKEKDLVSTGSQALAFYENQKERGQNGFGYVSFDKKVESYKRFRKEEELRTGIMAEEDIHNIIFHHRIPTSTPNYAGTTHPILVSHKELRHDYYVIHNGMISNDKELHDEHVALGYVYNTVVKTTVETMLEISEAEEWNDSEAFAIDLSRYIEGKQDKIESRGSIAFIALQVDKKSKKVLRVYFGRNNGNPLTFDVTADQLILRSKGGSNMLVDNELTCLDLSTWTYTKESVKIGKYAEYTGYFNHREYDDDYYDYNGYKKNNNEIGEDVQATKEVIDTEISKIDKKIATLEEELDFINGEIDYYKGIGAKQIEESFLTDLGRITRQLDELYAERIELLS